MSAWSSRAAERQVTAPPPDLTLRENRCSRMHLMQPQPFKSSNLVQRTGLDYCAEEYRFRYCDSIPRAAYDVTRWQSCACAGEMS